MSTNSYPRIEDQNAFLPDSDDIAEMKARLHSSAALELRPFIEVVKTEENYQVFTRDGLVPQIAVFLATRRIEAHELEELIRLGLAAKAGHSRGAGKQRRSKRLACSAIPR